MLGGSSERNLALKAANRDPASMPVHAASPPSQSGPLQEAAAGKNPSPVATVAQPPDNADATNPDQMNHKKPLLAPATSRSSSKADQQSTLDHAQETTKNDSENTLRGSKRSFLKGRSRDRSRGSSRRSQPLNEDAASLENRKEAAAHPGGEPPPAKAEKKSRFPFRFFAFLACCSPHDGDADGDVPPKTVRPGDRPPNRQSPTPEKTESAAGDPNATESTDPGYYGEEKPKPTVTSDHTHQQQAAAAPWHADDEGQPVQGQGGGGPPSTVGQSAFDHDPTHDKGVSAQDASAEEKKKKQKKKQQQQDEPSQFDQQHATAAVLPGQPDPTTDPSPSEAPQTKDDAYSHNEEAGWQGELPPPPPGAPPGQDGDQWLLPAARPPLQNRKCLVLDLDETLVHSSFKVRVLFDPGSSISGHVPN